MAQVVEKTGRKKKWSREERKRNYIMASDKLLGLRGYKKKKQI